MSDLISRSELISALKEHFDSCFREDGKLLYSDHICTSDDVADLIKLIENQPTAYDISRVVEELEKELEKGNIAIDFGEFRLFEIVKQGGVSDDACEWKYNDSEYYFESSCDHLHIFMSDGLKENEYEFCPYCGKKIKVVD